MRTAQRGDKCYIVHNGMEEEVAPDSLEWLLETTVCLVCGGELQWEYDQHDHVYDGYCSRCKENTTFIEPKGWKAVNDVWIKRHN